MEKRFYMGLGILVVFLILGLVVVWAMGQVSQPIVSRLEQAAAAVRSGDLVKGAQFAQQARELWKTGWKQVALAADHSPMDEIDGLFAQIDYFAQAGNATELGACCARVAELVEAVGDAHALTWWNIL